MQIQSNSVNCLTLSILIQIIAQAKWKGGFMKIVVKIVLKIAPKNNINSE